MSTSVLTQQIATADTNGSPIQLAYGFVWATGKSLAKYMLQNTGNSSKDYTRLGGWGLGLGEWDGCIELWINDILTWTSENDDPTQFHFHRGADAVIGSGLVPSSIGPDQGCDAFWQYFPSAVQPLCYNRLAYYMIKRKQPIIDSTRSQSDASQWTDIAPIGLWRSRRCRLFDASGNQTGYAFTTNPAWQILDAILMRRVKPDYNIDLTNGPTGLTAAEQARFNWASFFEAGTYYDQFLANGRRRFTFSGYIANSGTLNAVLEPMLRACRSYLQEDGPRIELYCDMPRPAVFDFKRKHEIDLQPTDRNIHSAPNRLIGKFRDLLVPVAAKVASITGGANPVVTTEDIHPFVKGDNIIVGNVGIPYDGEWVVFSVPNTVDANGNPNPTSFTLTSKGSQYTTNMGAGGVVGLTYSRFKERAPEFPHKRNQLARGAIGVGIPRQRNMLKQDYDLSVSSFDQASRVMQYERDRMLGTDVDPYITPASLTLKAPLCAGDDNGNLASDIRPGNVINIDSSASVPYAGEYEVQVETIRPITAQASPSGNSVALTPSPDGGEIELELQAFSDSYMYDSSLDTQAGWDDVPNSDPGAGTTASGSGTSSAAGTFSFLTGSVPSGGSFSLPSSGYSAANVLAWASPQGWSGSLLFPGAPVQLNYAGEMHTICECQVGATLRCMLGYTDGTSIWNGDVNYAALCWTTGSSVSVTTSGGLTWVQITLVNGEIVAFGQGIFNDGNSFTVPAGFSAAQMFAQAMPYGELTTGGVPSGEAHGVSCWVDSANVVHCQYTNKVQVSGDPVAPTTWSGSAQVLIFAWKNNSSTAITTAVTGGEWVTIPNSATSVLSVGLVRVSDQGTLPVPGTFGTGTLVQTLPSPRSIAAAPAGLLSGLVNSSPTPGIAACYLDSSLKLFMKWGDGTFGAWSGDWSGDAMVFALSIGPPAGSGSGSGGGSPSISISPLTASVVETSGYQQFVATVTNESITTVTWSVDGIAGGNVMVGTISAAGLYTAPATAGMHTVMATATASSSLTASATVTVTAPLGGGGWAYAPAISGPSAG